VPQHRIAVLAVLAAGALALTGCAEATPSASSSSAAPASSSAAALTGSITVDAAASLSVVFPAMVTSFEAEHPDTTITVNYGGSSALAAAIVSGAPVDVFAAASTATMKTVTNAQLTATAPITVAQNQLEIAVPPSNPGDITGIKDFAKKSKTIVVCAVEVPCGAAAQTAFAAAGITAKPDSYEPDVTSVLTKVENDDADAGMVYVTDVLSAGDKVKGIPLSTADAAITAYPIAAIGSSKNPTLAAAWVSYVKDNEAVLQSAGFLAP
jgi:molybdate transport system substrate-binding protein